MKFVRVLEQFHEGGILQVWYEHVEYSLILLRRRELASNRNIAIKFSDLRILFLLWSVGISLATIVFVAEISSHRYKTGTITHMLNRLKFKFISKMSIARSAR